MLAYVKCLFLFLLSAMTNHVDKIKFSELAFWVSLLIFFALNYFSGDIIEFVEGTLKLNYTYRRRLDFLYI